MPDPKDSDSLFRKIVRFVANPATDWADLNSRQDDIRENELEKSELKAMIERKRRNDFVRKREFDMLRKVRREGLSPEQLAALGNADQAEDSEGRMIESGAKQDAAVRDKIDEIEQQMVGDGLAAGTRRPPQPYTPAANPSLPPQPYPPTPPAPRNMPAAARQAAAPAAPSYAVPTQPSPAADLPDPIASPPPPRRKLEPLEMDFAPSGPPKAPAIVPTHRAGNPLPPLGMMNSGNTTFNQALAVEVSEVVHDPELDEPVIAFANADFESCETALTQLTSPQGSRAQHAETWLVLFDLYRAIGQQQKFESFAVDYAQQFGWSAPQWFSMPRLVAEAAGEERQPRNRATGEIGWACPEVLDAEAVARLNSQTLQMPLPWVFDFGALHVVEAEACTKLSELLRQWANEPLDMRWLSGERLFSVLAEAAPTAVRDVDPAFWLLRLDALRVANRPDQFDEAAIDYCVTYEVSPPSWERARCSVRISGSTMSTQAPPLSVVSDVSTMFVESVLAEDAGNAVQVAGVELSGQLSGDIGETLTKLNGELGAATIVNVSCAKLIRVDFIAAGDLLNWVLNRRKENRQVNFVDAHRLVALFFGAMGINEHAKVKVRNI